MGISLLVLLLETNVTEELSCLFCAALHRAQYEEYSCLVFNRNIASQN